MLWTLWIAFYFGLTLNQLAKSQNASNPDSNWDLLIMSQSWTPTLCIHILREHGNMTCTVTNPVSWHMHGIWIAGQIEGTTINCNDTWLLDTEEISALKPELDRYWTDILDSEPNLYRFWSHEWIKHGTCVASLETLNSPLKYFKQGLKWITQYSLTNVLSEAGIFPSDDAGYNVEDFFEAISSKFKVTPEVKCMPVGDNTKQFLVEVFLCFNRSLQLTDCVRKSDLKLSHDPNDITSVRSCDMSKEALYLSTLDNLSEYFDSSNNSKGMIAKNDTIDVELN